MGSNLISFLYEIRRAKIEDLGKISELVSKLVKKEYDEFDKTIDPDHVSAQKAQDYFKQRIEDDDKGILLVAEVGKEVIGYFIGGLGFVEDYRLLDLIAEGESMFILDQYRSLGIGAEFIRLFENWCREKNIKRVRIVASAGNTEAIKFYHRLGYEDYDVKLEKDL